MPVRLAKRLCPDLFIVRGDMDSYSKYSRVVTEIVADQVPLFEKASIDEFYVDMSGMHNFFGCSQYYCKQNGIKPVAGAEIRNDSTFLYILLAKNNKGFHQINRFHF